MHIHIIFFRLFSLDFISFKDINQSYKSCLTTEILKLVWASKEEIQTW